MIWFNGRSSDDFSLVVEQYPPRPIPKRKIDRWSVPGRSGDVIEAQNAWENVTRTYEVYLSAEGLGLTRVAGEAITWLMEPGYHMLWDEYDLDTFTMATLEGGIDIQNIQNEFGRFTLSFDCWPQRFLQSGAMPVNLSESGDLVNPTVYTAEPLIVVHGAGSGVLTIGEAGCILADCDEVTLDCREREAMRGVLNFNTTITGTFPTLPSGSSTVSWSGGITGVTITPRWFVL